MAFNGSGTFARLYNWVNDAAAAIKIRADRMDAEMDGFATGLSTCITKDGQTTLTANIPFAGFKITGYGSGSAPTSRTDVPSLGQVQDGKLNWVDGGGTADAITAAYAIPITALVDGQICLVRATGANTVTTPTFSPSGLTARTIVKGAGTALLVGDIPGDQYEMILKYDLTNTRWTLLNPYKIDLTADVSGDLPFANLAQGSALSVLGVTGNATADNASIAAASDHQVMRRSGTAVAFGAVNLAQAAAVTGTLPAGNLPSASTSASGIVELATDAEAQAGTDTARALTPSNLAAANINRASAQATTSGTSIDFTSIPSWVKRITVTLYGVSTNGTSNLLLQIGDSGGVETSGYDSRSVEFGGASPTSTAGFILESGGAATHAREGAYTLSNHSGNIWVGEGIMNASNVCLGAGGKTLSATLDRVRLTTVNGTDAFDAGEVNILYE